MENRTKKGNLFVLSGPSGVGKTTLTIETIKRIHDDFDLSKVITYTTRPKRKNEINGKDYYFLSHKEFEEKIKSDFFLETTRYDNHLYGSPISILQDLNIGKSFAIITDLDGVKNIAHLHNAAVLVWISPPNINDLRKRIIGRGIHTEKKIENRLKLAEKEIEQAHQKTRIFKYFVVNENFEQTVNELIVLIKDELNK
ncbi:guanylate kinase [Candidatus Dependentiae bacterium]